MKRYLAWICSLIHLLVVALFCTFCEIEYTPMNQDEPFRVALSLSPFSLNQ